MNIFDDGSDIKKYNQMMIEKLQAPFAPPDIEWRVGSTSKDKSKGMALAYVTNRAIQNRLDEVFGPFGWKNEFKEWKSNSQLCGISVKVDGEWITKWDGADDSNMEATKGGLSDAMKRAAYQWGIGRYLYKLDAIWVPLKDGKYLQYEPQLPEWALPKGFKQEKKSNRSVEDMEYDLVKGLKDAIEKQPIQSQTVGDIKKLWLLLGYKVNAIDVQIEKLYNVKGIIHLSEEDGQDLLAKLHEQKRIRESDPNAIAAGV